MRPKNQATTKVVVYGPVSRSYQVQETIVSMQLLEKKIRKEKHNHHTYSGCGIKNYTRKHVIFLRFKKLNNLPKDLCNQHDIRKTLTKLKYTNRFIIITLEIAIASSKPGGGVSNSSPSFSSPNFVN